MNCENRSAQIRKLDRSVIVGRIEMIARELAGPRRMVESAFPPEAPSSLTSQLLGHPDNAYPASVINRKCEAHELSAS